MLLLKSPGGDKTAYIRKKERANYIRIPGINRVLQCTSILQERGKKLKTLEMEMAVCHSDSKPGFHVVIEGIVTHYELIFRAVKANDIEPSVERSLGVCIKLSYQ